MQHRSKSDKPHLDLSNKNKWFFYQNKFFYCNRNRWDGEKK